MKIGQKKFAAPSAPQNTNFGAEKRAPLSQFFAESGLSDPPPNLLDIYIYISGVLLGGGGVNP